MKLPNNLEAVGLHQGRGNTLCACGPCRHRLRVLASRLGVTVDALKDLLRVEQPPRRTPARRAQRPRSIGVVAERATVTVDGRQSTGPAAILAAVRALQDPGKEGA